MLIDYKSNPSQLDQSKAAVHAEALGFAGIALGETKHDAFVSLATAAAATSRITLTTGVAIALSRTPMTLAYAARDLQELSDGRAQIGLGSQVQAHVERRFGMPWSKPVDRMKEYIEAVRSIWASWATSEPLAFEGDFYRHTLMTPNFAPDAHHDPPPILVAAVGQRMTKMAATYADGIMLHSLQSPLSIRAITAPMIGTAASHRSSELGPLAVYAMPFVVTGRTDDAMARAARAVSTRIGFYASTPAYRSVLALHGWEGLADESRRLVQEQKWDQLHAPIDDEMLDAFAIVAEPGRLRAALIDRYDGLAQRITLNTPYEVDPALIAEAVL